MDKSVTVNFEINGDKCEGCCFKITLQQAQLYNHCKETNVCGLFKCLLYNERCYKCQLKFGEIETSQNIIANNTDMIEKEKEKAEAYIAFKKDLITFDDYLKIINFEKYGFQENNTAPASENENCDDKGDLPIYTNDGDYIRRKTIPPANKTE